MFKVDDYIVYGKTGICKITDITVPKDICETDRLYYVLQPLYENCVIYAPVTTKIFIRPVISAEEVNRLIDMIPDIQAKAYYNNHLQELVEHYEAVISTYDCADLIGLAMSIFTKKKSLAQQNQKLGQTDERYLKQAENLLASEFSVALGILKDDVPAYITSRVKALYKNPGGAP